MQIGKRYFRSYLGMKQDRHSGCVKGLLYWRHK